MKMMSMMEKMQKDRDSKELKQQYNNLKEKEERMATRLEPLQEAATILAQVIEKKKKELTVLL